MIVADHLPLSELEQRVKKTSDPVERTRFLAVYHAKQGITATAIATITVHSTRWVQQVVRRYNQEGPAALKDRRHTTPGQQRPTLTLEEQQRVLAALQGPPPDGGWWTGPTLRDWVARELGKKRSRSPISRLVHELGFARRVPRPQQRQRDAQAQVEFKKLFQAVEAACREGRRVTLLADSEHRLGRLPMYRRVWHRTGERPTAVVAHRSRWCSVCTVVAPTTGWNLRLVVNGIDTQVMSWVVTELTATLADGEEAWVVVDRAGWHSSPRVAVPEGVRLIVLPPYSPELQPAERVWPVVNEAVANRYVQNLAEMMGVVAERGWGSPGGCNDPPAAHSLPLVAYYEGISMKGYHEGAPHALPRPVLRPLVPPSPAGAGRPVLLWQVCPGTARVEHRHHTMHCPAVVVARTTPRALCFRDERFDHRPLVVGEIMSAHTASGA